MTTPDIETLDTPSIDLSIIVYLSVYLEANGT